MDVSVDKEFVEKTDLVNATDIHLKNYCGELSLNNISFSIDEKGVYGFFGRTNSGKSALAQVLAGSCTVDSGRLCYKERQMFSSKGETANIKKKIGYAPQKCFFDDDTTVLEVLEFTGKVKGTDPDKLYRQIKEACELVGLSSKSETLVANLSLSEKKRLSIANAIISNPEVIILDDPLRYVDKEQANEIKNIVSMLSRKKVVLVFSSRALDIEEMCSYTALLSHGRIVLWDKVENILKKLSDNGITGLDAALDAFDEEKSEGGEGTC